jgi:hypothetical protein
MEFPKLPEHLSNFLISKPETGMVVLRDGRQFEDVLFVEASLITEVRGYDSIPFNPADIENIEITHSKWKRKTK